MLKSLKSWFHFSHLVLISLIIIFSQKHARSDNIRDKDGLGGCFLALASIAIPAVEYYSNEDGEKKWGAQFFIAPTFLLKDLGNSTRIYNQIKLSHTFLKKENDISRFHYVPYLFLHDTIGLGIPLGGYYHASDFGYSTGLIFDVYPSKSSWFKLFSAFDYRYNPKTKKDGYSIFPGLRFTYHFK